MITQENFTTVPYNENYELFLKGKDADVGGGTITKEEIDILKDYPHIKTVAIAGLHQDTFEYFIEKYGDQFTAIAFFKNKMVGDLSALGKLKNVEYIYYFFNQRVTKLWDMTQNVKLKGLGLDDFSRLHSFDNIETAPNLEYFHFGNAVWDKAVINDFAPLEKCTCSYLSLSWEKLLDDNISYIANIKNLKQLDVPGNKLTTEQFAWLVANRPDIEGRNMGPFDKYNDDSEYIFSTGKGKRTLIKGKDDHKVQRYIDEFDKLVAQYKGVSYKDAFANK